MAPDRAGIPVELLSGAHEARATAAELDAAAMVTKPFKLDDLAPAVARTLDSVA
jgi:DNA-binding response OmpR family regulator